MPLFFFTHSFLAWGFRLGMSVACGSVLNLRVNFTSHQKSEAGDIEPQQQNHLRPQGPVGLRIAIEEMQVHPEQKRSSQARENSERRARCDPIPMLFFYVRTARSSAHESSGSRLRASSTSPERGRTDRMLQLQKEAGTPVVNNWPPASLVLKRRLLIVCCCRLAAARAIQTGTGRRALRERDWVR